MHENWCCVLSSLPLSLPLSPQDKVVRLEQDAGSEFRQRMGLLKRQLEDARGTSESLETQLQSSRQHAEQYKEMSLTNENALAELNRTSEEFR